MGGAPWPRRLRHERCPGTNWVQTASPNVDQHQLASSQATRRPDRRSPGQGSLSGATSANDTKHALAGQADRRDGRHKHQAQLGRGARVRHPTDLPKGYHAASRGQAWQPQPAVGRDAAPGSRVVGRSQADGTPHSSQRSRSSAVVRNREAAQSPVPHWLINFGALVGPFNVGQR
jgi:hypothetical protein